MDQLLYTLYTVAFVILSGITFFVWRRSRSVGTLALLIVMVAMVYEDLVLALGVVIGHGALLESLSWVRFVGYATAPPLLVITALEIARRSGVAWANRPLVVNGSWIVATALGLFALFVEVLGRQLEPRILNDVVRYMWVSKTVPPIAVILMNLIVIGFGFAVWRKTKNAVLLVSGVFLFVGDGIAAGRYVLGSGIELVFMALLLGVELWALGHFKAVESAPALRAQRQAVGD